MPEFFFIARRVSSSYHCAHSKSYPLFRSGTAASRKTAHPQMVVHTLHSLSSIPQSSKFQVLSGIKSILLKIRIQEISADRPDFEQVHRRIQFLKCCKRDFLYCRVSVVLIRKRLHNACSSHHLKPFQAAEAGILIENRNADIYSTIFSLSAAASILTEAAAFSFQ